MDNLEILRSKLNARQQRFVDNYLQGTSATQAYKDAGYKATSESSATSSANEILTNLDISNYIKAVQSKNQTGMIVGREELLEGYSKMFRLGVKIVESGAEEVEEMKTVVKGGIAAGQQISKMQGYDAPTEIIQKSTDLTHEQLEEELTKRGLGRRPNQLASKKNEE